MIPDPEHIRERAYFLWRNRDPGASADPVQYWIEAEKEEVGIAERQRATGTKTTAAGGNTRVTPSNRVSSNDRPSAFSLPSVVPSVTPMDRMSHALPAIEWEPLSLEGLPSFMLSDPNVFDLEIDIPVIPVSSQDELDAYISHALDEDISGPNVDRERRSETATATNRVETRTFRLCFHAIELSRDVDWQLEATVFGKSERGLPFLLPTPQQRAGQMISPIPEVHATAMSGASLSLRDFHLGTMNGDLAGNLQRRIRASGARVTWGDIDSVLTSVKSCMIWCLNGPEEQFPFTLGTIRERIVRYQRERVGFSPRDREVRGFESALDSILIPAPEYGIGPSVLAAVPKGLNIERALRPVAIEFGLPTPASVPSWDQLEPYLVGLSFVIGRRLIPVGYTFFDDTLRQRLHDLRSAWAVDLRAECARPFAPPVDVNEAALAALVPKFVEGASQFGLVDAMWLVWLADSVPLEAALPNLATALESVMSVWFRSTKTKSGGKYMPDAEWKALSAEPLGSLAAALTGRAHADRIERRARGANNFGVNERFEQFFGEIELSVGEVELKAIGARNKAAHGGGFSATQYQWLGDTVRAYRTLISRVILTLLGWEGECIDYSTHGFPKRSVKDALGGPEGDSTAARF